jgi:cytochrome P450
VRITPDEVHLSDPNNYEIIYSVGTKYAKSSPFYDAFGIRYSTFSTGPNNVHRVRRGRLDPFFSRRTVLQLEHIVEARAEKLTRLLSSKFANNEAVDLHHAFRAISVDVITDYAFGESYHILDTPDLGLNFFEMVQGIGPTMWIFQQWPALQKLSLSLPASVAGRMSKPLKHVLNLQKVVR